MSWHQIQKIFPGLLNICAKFEEIPSTSKDAIGRQNYGAPRGTLNYTEHLTKAVFGSLYVVTRFSISEQHFSLDKMHQMKDICHQ